MHALAGIGLIGLIAKLHKWDESAMFFDGSSLGEFVYICSFTLALFMLFDWIAVYVFSIAVYITVIIPTLRTIVTPLVDVDTRGDMVDAMRVLSAANVIIMVCLGAILVLQVRKTDTGLTLVDNLTKPSLHWSGWARVCEAV